LIVSAEVESTNIHGNESINDPNRCTTVAGTPTACADLGTERLICTDAGCENFVMAISLARRGAFGLVRQTRPPDDHALGCVRAHASASAA